MSYAERRKRIALFPEDTDNHKSSVINSVQQWVFLCCFCAISPKWAPHFMKKWCPFYFCWINYLCSLSPDLAPSQASGRIWDHRGAWADEIFHQSIYPCISYKWECSTIFPSSQNQSQSLPKLRHLDWTLLSLPTGLVCKGLTYCKYWATFHGTMQAKWKDPLMPHLDFFELGKRDGRESPGRC